jgi:hypothetical protein
LHSIAVEDAAEAAAAAAPIQQPAACLVVHDVAKMQRCS